MPVRVRIPTPLRKHTGERAEVTAEGTTIKEVFEDLDRQFPGFQKALYEEDRTLKRFINVYLNDEDIRYIGGETTPVKTGNTVSIVPAIAGGSALRGASLLERAALHGVLVGLPSPPKRFRKVGVGGVRMAAGSSG